MEEEVRKAMEIEKQEAEADPEREAEGREMMTTGGRRCTSGTQTGKEG